MFGSFIVSNKLLRDFTEARAHAAGVVHDGTNATDRVLDLLLNDGSNDLVLAGEVVIEPARRDRRLLADLVGRRAMEAVAKKAGTRGFDDLLPSRFQLFGLKLWQLATPSSPLVPLYSERSLYA